MRVRTISPLLLLAVVLASCGGSDDPAATDTTTTTADTVTVTGSVLYRERIAMPEGAVVTVKVLDVSLQDAAAVEIAEQVITDPGNVPVAFEIPVHSDQITESNTYAVEASITDGDGTLRWRNDTLHPVLTQGAGTDIGEIIVIGIGA